MTAAVKTSGSLTTTVGTTEQSLATVTDAGTYQAAIDVAAMAGGTTPDLLEIRIYGKARSTDTERLIDSHGLAGAQSAGLWLSKPYLSPHSLRVAVLHSQGTSRALPWAIYAA